ncbi:hypothetical protein EXIGLDRAFT_752194 [Exidia glandulosa HHB12029]|uniref:Uncharacterized protein n=1 Tax=Exidia glandulosa HHB12029 TaxID=1314781 RepID=A0A165ER73_EXIGL|nr:hypothetical protein EXIGLDRAFT_752194 [Exidia glandulosa HHB12029]
MEAVTVLGLLTGPSIDEFQHVFEDEIVGFFSDATPSVQKRKTPPLDDAEEDAVDALGGARVLLRKPLSTLVHEFKDQFCSKRRGECFAKLNDLLSKLVPTTTSEGANSIRATSPPPSSPEREHADTLLPAADDAVSSSPELLDPATRPSSMGEEPPATSQPSSAPPEVLVPLFVVKTIDDSKTVVRAKKKTLVRTQPLQIEADIVDTACFGFVLDLLARHCHRIVHLRLTTPCNDIAALGLGMLVRNLSTRRAHELKTLYWGIEFGEPLRLNPNNFSLLADVSVPPSSIFYFIEGTQPTFPTVRKLRILSVPGSHETALTFSSLVDAFPKTQHFTIEVPFTDEEEDSTVEPVAPEGLILHQGKTSGWTRRNVTVLLDHFAADKMTLGIVVAPEHFMLDLAVTKFFLVNGFAMSYIAGRARVRLNALSGGRHWLFEHVASERLKYFIAGPHWPEFGELTLPLWVTESDLIEFLATSPKNIIILTIVINVRHEGAVSLLAYPGERWTCPNLWKIRFVLEPVELNHPDLPRLCSPLPPPSVSLEDLYEFLVSHSFPRHEAVIILPPHLEFSQDWDTAHASLLTVVRDVRRVD